MSNNPRILIVDDDPIVAESLAQFLSREGYVTVTVGDGEEALAVLDSASRPAVGQRPKPKQHSPSTDSEPASASGNADDQQSAGPFGVVITDVNMPRLDGIEFLRRIRKSFESVVPIIITGFGKIEAAVEAVKLGAADYLTKPVVDDELRIAVGKAVRQHLLLAENQTLRSQLVERYGLDQIVGSDYRMQKIYDLVEAVAESKTTVLIDGESGTGKTMVARAIHTLSPRRAGPFVTFSCGAIPETLLESELFGHVKGAFTGADTDKQGKLQVSDGGTLFIDEINSATPALQLKLLRVLQERQFEPVGSNKTSQVDVRFVLATNQSLAELVTKNLFREDLYYRINVVNIHMPSLRERVGDIPVLAEHFLSKYAGELGKERRLSEEAIEAMRRYPWPGNVRELENAVERAMVLSRKPMIELSDLPDTVQRLVTASSAAPTPSNGNPSAAGHIPALEGGWKPMPLQDALLEPERQILLAALKANQWNRQTTARELNINRTTLYKKIKQFKLDEIG